MQKKILMIGCGAMGTALASFWQDHYELTIIDPVKQGCLKTIDELEDSYQPDVIVLAVKPQALADVILPYTKRFDQKEILWISIAAGAPLSFFKEHLKQSPIVRVMPNLPVRFQQGMSGLVTDGQMNPLADELFKAVGRVVWLDDEDKIDAVTAIAGSGPAYFYLMVEALAKAGESLGLSLEISALLARQTAVGAGVMLQQLEESPSVLRAQVTSPGGTTAAALSVLMAPTAEGLENLMLKAAQAAFDRAKELANSK